MIELKGSILFARASGIDFFMSYLLSYLGSTAVFFPIFFLLIPVLNLLKKIQEERKLTYLFISHDLSVVKYISDKIGVMYLGSMVEFGNKEEIFNNPLHPYTKALFSAIPNPDPDEKAERIILKGDIPSPANPPKGCKFHTRCPKAMEICQHVAPKYQEYEEGHFVACHCYEQE